MDDDYDENLKEEHRNEKSMLVHRKQNKVDKEE